MADLLIVDDDADATEALAGVLDGEGHRVRVAFNGNEGLLSLRTRRADLIILDVEMPVLSGPEMARSLAAENHGLEKIPILLCSGVPGLSKVAATVGTPYYVAKPFGLEAFCRLLERALVERAPPSPHPPRRS